MTSNTARWIELPEGWWRGSLSIWMAGAVAVAAGVELPRVGIPLALAWATYGWMRLLKPYMIMRGRTLSNLQQHHAATITAAAVLAIAVAWSSIVYGLDVAGSLEQRLHDRIELGSRDSLHVGDNFSECKVLICAGAVIMQVPVGKTLGVAKLSGFTLHYTTLYGWQNTRPARFAAAATAMHRETASGP